MTNNNKTRQQKQNRGLMDGYGLTTFWARRQWLYQTKL